AGCCLTYSHDGDSKAFRERAIAAFLTRIGQANGFALSFGQLRPTNGFAGLSAFSFGSNHAGNDALADHSAFEFSEDAEHLKHGFARGRRGIDSLSMQVQPDSLGMQVLEKRDQIL